MKDNFPRPYINDAKKNEDIMVYVPTDNGDIGNRKSNTPGNIKTSGLSLDHVSNRKI